MAEHTFKVQLTPEVRNFSGEDKTLSVHIAAFSGEVPASAAAAILFGHHSQVYLLEAIESLHIPGNVPTWVCLTMAYDTSWNSWKIINAQPCIEEKGKE